MKRKTNQITGTGTESEKWTWRVFSGEGEGRTRWENVQGRSVIGRHKIVGERLRVV